MVSSPGSVDASGSLQDVGGWRELSKLRPVPSINALGLGVTGVVCDGGGVWGVQAARSEKIGSWKRPQGKAMNHNKETRGQRRLMRELLAQNLEN